jgi:hypothetical protein
LARYWTNPPTLELASAAATVSALCVAVVAILARFNALVAARGCELAGLSGRACIPGVLHRAVGVTAIVVLGVAIVANLARADGAVAANDISRTGAGFGTGPVGFDLANTVAAITGKSVPVVALLDAVLVVDSVAASLGHPWFADRGVHRGTRAVGVLATRTARTDGGESEGATYATPAAVAALAASPGRACACTALPALYRWIRAGDSRKSENYG